MGTEDIKTVNCDTTTQTCTIDVPAPGFALVFLTDDAFTEDKGMPTTTFPTTVHTKTRNTGTWYLLLCAAVLIRTNPATVDPSVLVTSNGYRMFEHELAGTSKPPSAAPRTAQVSLIVAGVVIGAVVALLGRAM
jgi:hypothetical protein